MSRSTAYVHQQCLSNYPEGLVKSPRLLSIDGGGVRGLCSLLVLDRLMQEVKKLEVLDYPDRKDSPRLPCRYFELAGGTSIGGLIAIMLFRLHMDTSDAIAMYERISPDIFKSGLLSYIGGNAAKALVRRPWFKGETLVKAVKQIVEEFLPDEERKLPGIDIPNTTLLQTTETLGGVYRMFMCALKKEDDSTVRFRNYIHPDAKFEQCTIWEAARATSAAPFYFPTAMVDGVKFWDGGLENNNPIDEVLAKIGSEQPACVISLGTGFSERKQSKSIIPALSKGKKILSNLIKVEGRHCNVKERMKSQGVMYFRFNPSTANDDISLAKYSKMDKLKHHTLEYIKQGDIELEIKLCAKILVSVSAYRSQTPLLLVVETGNEAVVKLLLEKGADLESRDRGGWTPLSRAAVVTGNEAVVKLVLEKGADLESRDRGGRTPLSWAAVVTGNEAVVKLLLEKGADLESRDEVGRTPLSRAAETGNEAVVKLLLEKGADLESRDRGGRTPLSRAAETGNEAVVKLLLEKGVDLESRDEVGRTPLSRAAETGNEAVVKLLLEKGVDLESRDEVGRTPLSRAAETGNEAVVKLLLEKGVDLESRDRGGWTPLSRAAVVTGNEAVVKLLKKSAKKL